MADKLKAVVIGAGEIARTAHVPNYLVDKRVELVAIADQNRGTCEKLCKKYGIARSYTDAFLMIRKEKPDLASICTPPNTHYGFVEVCAENGVNILCEKPFALSTKEAERMVSITERKKVLLALGYTLRFFDNFELVKKTLLEEKLGKLFSVVAVYHHQTPEKSWMFDQKVSGGGVVVDKASHVVDLLNWWIGSDVVDVCAFQAESPRDTDVEEAASIVLQYENRVPALVSLSWIAAREHEEFIVSGTAGVIKAGYRYAEVGYGDLLETKMYKQGRKALFNLLNLVAVYPPSKTDPYQKEICDFVSAVLRDRKPRATGTDGLKVTKIIERIYNKLRKGHSTSQ
jgi:predicted dehydrogenase